MTTPGFIVRRVLDPARQVLRVVRDRGPRAIVERVAMCVRFGPMTPTIIGLPLIAWQPRHPPWLDHQLRAVRRVALRRAGCRRT